MNVVCESFSENLMRLCSAFGQTILRAAFTLLSGVQEEIRSYTESYPLLGSPGTVLLWQKVLLVKQAAVGHLAESKVSVFSQPS